MTGETDLSALLAAMEPVLTDAVWVAALLPTLAAAGIGVNPVSAYFHDHLFVPADRADEALALLRGIAAKAR
jgi:hypothetical protein